MAEVKKSDKNSKQKIDMNQNLIDNLKVLQEYEYINKEPYKAAAYAKVIDNIELMENKVNKDNLKTIKGLGKKIEEKIKEYIETGKISQIEKIQQDDKYILGKKVLEIYGVGPVKVNDILSKITSFEDLSLPENESLLNDKQKIGLKYYNDLKQRIPYEEAKKHYTVIQKFLKSVDKDITFEMVGSYRRKNKSIGDIDILIKNNGLNLKKLIVKMQEYIIETLAIGKNKFMGICKLSPDFPARRIDILITEPDTYNYALLYFTGSYNFNIYMRRIALKKGLSLSEYGFKNLETKELMKIDEIKSEEDIFNYLEIPFVPPAKR